MASFNSRHFQPTEAHLLTYLCGTLDKKSSLSKLRGHSHLLRHIWLLVCEEWWSAHIERYKSGAQIPELLCPWMGQAIPDSEIEEDADAAEDSDDEQNEYPKFRQRHGGCPIAVIAKDMTFPPLTTVPPGTFANQVSDELYVNMMPIELGGKIALPEVCRGYLPLIKKCSHIAKAWPKDWQKSDAYLTIDERTVLPDTAQRRQGLHVESPGILPPLDSPSVKSPSMKQATSNSSRNVRSNQEVCSCLLQSITGAGGMFVPGAEHHWGRGMMMRHERVDGGIFMASNVANTTAVWNCRVRDDQGDIIGPHGDLERCRNVLGPATRTLEAGELIWMTDKTPHESLPLPAGVTRRQYFRLVVGEVSAWFADHSTPNPLGVKPGPGVRIIRGNKFDLYRSVSYRWSCGDDAEALQAAKAETELRGLLSESGVGHLAESVVSFGVESIAQLVAIDDAARTNTKVHYSPTGNQWSAKNSRDGLPLFRDVADYYYDMPAFKRLLREAKKLVEATAPDAAALHTTTTCTATISSVGKI